MAKAKAFLFLQGPVGSFFKRLGAALQAEGHACWRINLCLGDQIFWSGANARNYRGSFEAWPAYLKNFITENGITNIVLLGECRPYHRVAIDIAKEIGIEVTVTDFGYLRPDWITLEPFAMNAGSLLTRDPKQLAMLAKQTGDKALPEAERFDSRFISMALPDLLYNISSQLFWFMFPHYQSHQKYNAATTYIGLGIRLLRRTARNRKANNTIAQLAKKAEESPVFLFPLQMETDYQLRAYSQYQSMEEPLELVMRSFANSAVSNARLVVKLHPYDPIVKNFPTITQKLAARYGIANRVLFIDGGSNESLLRCCKGVVTVNSTMGLQSLIEGTPVFTLADCNYRVDGLVKFEDLDAFWQEPGQVDTKLRDIFVHALIACCMVRGVFYDEPGLTNAIREAKQRLVDGTVGKPQSDAKLDPPNLFAEEL